MNYITDKELENSLSVQIGNYMFAVQFKKGNNILMEKVSDEYQTSLIDAIIAFIEFCRKRQIQYLTVESRNKSDIYYKIALRYFPYDSFFMDNNVLRICLDLDRCKSVR